MELKNVYILHSRGGGGDGQKSCMAQGLKLVHNVYINRVWSLRELPWAEPAHSKGSSARLGKHCRELKLFLPVTLHSGPLCAKVLCVNPL